MAGPIFWGVGNHSWQAPFAARNGSVYCAAGGGGGYKDNEGPGTNGRGGGGGGGGAYTVGVSLTSQAFYSISVGGGGGIGSPGGPSSFTGSGVFVYAGGGERGKDGVGGAGGSPGGGPGGDDGNANNPGGQGGSSPGPGYGGRGNIVGTRSATRGGNGSVGISWDYHPPTVSITNNNSIITAGETTTLVYSSTWVTSLSITNIGPAAGNGTYAVTVSPTSTTTYCISGSGPGGSAGPACTTITVYPPPVINNYYVSDSNPLSGDTVTLYWSTSGASSVSRSSSNSASGLGAAGGMTSSGSLTFTAGTGGAYNTVLTATNGAGKSVTSTPVVFTVRDETPNAFEWDDKLDCAPPGSLQESNTIIINGFGPTQYTNSYLPIKSNYPVQVMVNGDGVWRNVEEI